MVRARRSLVVCILMTCALVLPAASPAEASSPSKVMVSKINKFRKAHGLRPVHMSGALNRSSYRYARYMMRHHYFGHASHIHASGSFRMLGEVLAMHQGRHPRPSLAVNGWKRSAIHRRVLLHPAFRYIGAGRAYGRFHGRRSMMWVVQLGKK